MLSVYCPFQRVSNHSCDTLICLTRAATCVINNLVLRGISPSPGKEGYELLWFFFYFNLNVIERLRESQPDMQFFVAVFDKAGDNYQGNLAI